MILRDTSNPPLTDKGSALTYGEFDGNFVEIYNAIQDIVNGANVTAYDAGATYDLYSTNPKEKFVSYNSRIWQAAYVGSPSSFTGQTPAEGSYWTQVSLAQMLGNPVALTKIAEAFDDTLEASTIYETDWISSSEINLNASPLSVILSSGDPSVGYAPCGLSFQLDAGVVFAFATAPYLAYDSTPSTKLEQIPTAQFNSATDVFYNVSETSKSVVFNDKVILTAATDSATGTGVYYVKVYFRKVTKQF